MADNPSETISIFVAIVGAAALAIGVATDNDELVEAGAAGLGVGILGMVIFGDRSAGAGSDTGSAGGSPDSGNTGDPGEAGGDESGAGSAGGLGQGGACFTGSTPVRMADGSLRRIDRVVVGDQVLAREACTGLTRLGTVTRTFVHTVDETLLLLVGGSASIETTAEHRFAIAGGQFVAAGRLRQGDTLVTWDQQAAELLGSEVRRDRTEVYNLEVSDGHTYFVGTSGCWVHNRKDEEDGPVAGTP